MFFLFLSFFLSEKIGKGKNYSDALILGKRYTAQDGLSSGMIHAIQPFHLLLNESIRVLKSFYGKGYSRDSLRNMKEDVYRESLACYEREINDLSRMNANDISAKL